MTMQRNFSNSVNACGCPRCARKIITPDVSIASTDPKLMKEWNFEENVIDPTKISRGYDKKVKWHHKVKVGNKIFEHNWEASPNSRTNMNSKCPYCNNKKVMEGYNDLKTFLPQVACLFDEEKNYPRKVQDYTPGSSERVYWKDRDRAIKMGDRTKYLQIKKEKEEIIYYDNITL